MTTLQRKIPDDCERILQIKVPEIKPGDDARVQLAKHRAALAVAKKALEKSHECNELIRDHYLRE